MSVNQAQRGQGEATAQEVRRTQEVRLEQGTRCEQEVCRDQGKYSLQDMHCHLDFADNANDLARQVGEQGMRVFSTTVSPKAYRHIPAWENVCVGLGFHPWWVSEDASSNNDLLELLLNDLPSTTYVGEIGLDCASRHQNTAEEQRRVLSTVFEALRNHEPSTLSLHCIQAYDAMFGLLDAAQIWDNHVVIFHWFSGSSDDLVKARSKKAFFSLNARMLTTKRGRAYAQALPLDALLIETDWPPEQVGAASFDEWYALVQRSYDLLADIRSISQDELACVLEANANRALRLFA